MYSMAKSLKSENVKSELKFSWSDVIKVFLICPILEIDASIHIHIIELETFLILFNLRFLLIF